MPEFFKRTNEPAKTFSSNFFAKKPLVKKPLVVPTQDQNRTNSPNKNENESKMSTATSSKKKISTIGTYELGPIIGDNIKNLS